MADLAGIKARIHTIDLVQEATGPAKGPDGQGRWITRCPFHEDSTPSFRVTADGGYLCFGCGAKGGDVIDFVAAHRNLTLQEAIAALDSEAGSLPPASSPRRPSTKAPAPAGVVARPIPASIESKVRETGTIALNYPDREKPEVVSPTAIYAYRRERNGLASHLVLRIDSGGRKIFRPACWDGEKWWGQAGPTPRPLYGLERIGTGHQVLVVEGEKAADAAAARLPEQIGVVTWQGGSSSVKTADWEPLAGRSVVIWPDADAPGAKAAEAVYGILEGLGCRLKVVDTDGLPDGFDAADLDAGEDMLLWLKGRAQARPSSDAPAAPRNPEDPSSNSPGEVAQLLRDAEFPFTILGQHGDRAFFLKHSDGRIVNHGLTSLTRREVLGTLAPPHVWLRAFGGQDGEGRPIGWPTVGMSAQAHIIAACERRPSFDPDRVRGRGCWPHRGGVAFHRGDWVEVAGVRQPGNLVDGIIYESLSPIPIEVDQQTSDDEGARLLELINECSWADGSSGAALAGWIAIAPICGALPWRPHVWITGPSGSGKSTIMDEIVLPAVGRGLAIRVDGNTTEAGLRQAIGRDALPVLLDEAEPDAKSMRGILDLARSASTGDTVVRGTPGGGAQYFHIRSAFCFSAIDPAIAKRADESRISRLTLKPRTDSGADAHFRRLRDEIVNLIGEDFGARLAARSIALAPITLANIRTMEDAIASRYGSRRLAQQWACLIAGAWSLSSRSLMDPEAAARMAEGVPTESARAQTEESDSRAMLMHLCAYQIDVPAKGGRARVTIAELIERLSTKYFFEAQEITRGDAEDVLSRWGIRCDRKEVHVAVNYATLRNQVFRDTNWQHSYTARLRDLEGSRAGKQLRFAGQRCSSTAVPVWHFVGRDDDGGLGPDGVREDNDRQDQAGASERNEPLF